MIPECAGMTENAWLTESDPETLLAFLEDNGNVRKLRLLAIAACRAAWEQIPEPHNREAILVAEQHIDGMATERRSVCSIICPI